MYSPVQHGWVRDERTAQQAHNSRLDIRYLSQGRFRLRLCLFPRPRPAPQRSVVNRCPSLPDTAVWGWRGSEGLSHRQRAGNILLNFKNKQQSCRPVAMWLWLCTPGIQSPPRQERAPSQKWHVNECLYSAVEMKHRQRIQLVNHAPFVQRQHRGNHRFAYREETFSTTLAHHRLLFS